MISILDEMERRSNEMGGGGGVFLAAGSNEAHKCLTFLDKIKIYRRCIEAERLKGGERQERDRG